MGRLSGFSDSIRRMLMSPLVRVKQLRKEAGATPKGGVRRSPTGST